MKQKTISNPDSVQLLIRYGADFTAGSAEKFPGKRGYTGVAAASQPNRGKSITLLQPILFSSGFKYY